MTDQPMTGRVALVAGASKGIGAATAEAFAAAGAAWSRSATSGAASSTCSKLSRTISMFLLARPRLSVSSGRSRPCPPSAWASADIGEPIRCVARLRRALLSAAI